MTTRDDERRKFEAWCPIKITDVTKAPKAAAMKAAYALKAAYWREACAELARTEQAETPQTREELEKEWLAQTEWQDFTNWLIHVKLREKLTDKCTCDSIVGPHCIYAGHKIT